MQVIKEMQKNVQHLGTVKLKQKEIVHGLH